LTWAVVAFVEDEGHAPPLLVSALECRQWGCMPDGISRADQPAGLLTKMTHVLNVYDQWSAYIRAESKGRGAKFKQRADPHLRQFLDYVIEGKQ